MIELQLNIGVEHAMMPCLDEATGSRNGCPGFGRDFLGEFLIVLVTELRRSLPQRLRTGGLGFGDAVALEFSQSRHRLSRIDRIALEGFRRALRCILRQRGSNDRRAFEAKAFAEADHTIDDRAVEELTGAADQMPAEAVQPATVVQVFEEPLNVAAIGNKHIMVHAI